MKNGRIPARMVAYLKHEQDALVAGRPHSFWSFTPENKERPTFSKYKARAAFVVPVDSENFKASAAKWASETSPSRYCGKPKPFDTHGFDNKPFTNLRWVGIDSRGEGGVAYKVVTPQGWLVDMREDVMMECMLDGGVNFNTNGENGAGTYLTSKFVWVVMGSQCRIVRVGSKTHAEILESEDRKAAVPLKDGELEAGGVYQDKLGRKIILLDKGTEKGKKFLVIHHSSYRSDRETIPNMQAEVDGGIYILGNKERNHWPGWHFFGSLTVTKKVGKLKVPEGLMGRYIARLKLCKVDDQWRA